MRGTIHWYDDKSREGLIKDSETGALYYVHGSAFNESDKGISGGEICQFELYADISWAQVKSVNLIKGVEL